MSYELITMSELRIFYRDNGRIKIGKTMDTLTEVSLNEIIWIDLNDVTVEVESELEQFLKIYIQEEEEMEEIEISSRYMETEDSIVANSKFLLDSFEEEAVSFILKNNILVTVRNQHLRSFNETVKKMFANPRNYPSGHHVLVALLETRVEYDADLIEDMTREITVLSNQLKDDDDASDDILIAIKELQEKTMLIRENIVDKSRVMDRRFLNFVDGNNDGKIRTDEIREAVRFFLKHIKDGKGFEEGSATIELDAINEETGAALLQSAKLILKNLGKPEAVSLTLDELRNDKGIRSRSSNNGDGVVTLDPELPEALNARIGLVMKTAGAADDASGAKGVNAALIDKFAAESVAFLEWDSKIANDDGTLLCFGANTQTVYDRFLAVKEDIDNYFLNSETLEFFSVEPERVAKKDLAADVRAPQEVKAMLEKSVLALPRTDCTLDLNDKLNPLLRSRIEAFFSLEEAKALLADNKLTTTEWQNFKTRIAPYDGWSRSKPAFAPAYAAVDKTLLEGAANDETTELLKTACSNDLNAGTALAGIDMLHKLMLYQAYLKELLNNFVSLAELFDLEAKSPLQAGKLVMDGRHFTLAVPVVDAAEHKRIVAGSNICVLYVDLFSTAAGVLPPWKTLAVAVSSGNMRNLFVGKRGLFFTAGGMSLMPKSPPLWSSLFPSVKR